MWGDGLGKRKRIRLVFACVLVIFVIGFAAARTVGEPYPAILMPGFRIVTSEASPKPEESPGGAPARSTPRTLYAATEVELNYDGMSRSVSPARFFDTIPDSMRTQVLYRNFSPPEAWLATARSKSSPPSWRVALEESILPGLEIRREKPYLHQQLSTETLEWLRERARRLYPDETPTSLDVVWTALPGPSSGHENSTNPETRVRVSLASPE